MRTGIAVDGWCATNPGRGGYRGVDLETGKTLFSWSTDMTTNNLVEFLALVHAMKWIKENELNTSVWTDSVTALSWVRNKKCNTKFDFTQNLELKEMIDDCISFVKENKAPNLIKWDTKKYGEIPADFGRK